MVPVQREFEINNYEPRTLWGILHIQGGEGEPDLIWDVKKVGHLDERQFLQKRLIKKQATASSYLTRFEEATIYAKDQGEYLCECPRREALPEGAQATKEHETKMKVLDKLVENQELGNKKERLKRK